MLNTSIGISPPTRRAFYIFFVLLMTMFLAPLPLLAAVSNIPKSGQTTLYVTGDDGDLQEGVSWPSPRFTDNSNGTVTDNLTNLTWLKDANCYGAKTWDNALIDGSDLSHLDCGLSDSSFGSWRVPTIRELESLIHLGVSDPAVPDTAGTGKATNSEPFTSLEFNNYWSSTTNTALPSNALAVNLQWGETVSIDKSNTDVYTLFVRDSASGNPVAEVYATGQTLCYDNTGTIVTCSITEQDGDLQKGMVWPVPRFTDNNNGTVLDNLTGLTWLKNANCLGLSDWASSIALTSLLANSSCGLTDGSTAGDWRVPNRKELISLISFNSDSPALSNTEGTGQWSNNNPFTKVEPTSGYWSSTTYDGTTSHSWYVDLKAGLINIEQKINVAYVWPVRNDLTSTLSVSMAGDGSGTVTSSPAGISCPATCSGTFTEHSIVTLTAKADNGSRFEGWSDKSCAKNKNCQVTMSGAKSISVTFAENSSTVSSWMILLTK